MPVSSRGPRRYRSWWCHTCLSTPSTRTPAKRAGSSDAACKHGLIWDQRYSMWFLTGGPARDRSSLEAQLTNQPVDSPHTQMRPGSTHLLAALQECHRFAGVFAAYPAPFVLSDPRRDPGPGRVDHLHHHTPMTLSDHPTPRAPNQLVARLNIEHQSIWGASHAHQMEALQTDEQITPITTIKRHRAAAGRVRHCRGP